MDFGLKKKRILNIVFWICVFAGLFLYYYVAHPLILSDTDDWYYASYWRRPLPVWGHFNGIKVFPETAMPICSLIGANLIYPVFKNYLMSLAFVYALAGAGFIAVYVYLTGRLIKAVGKCSDVTSGALSLCFLMFHFLIYKNEWIGNTQLLWSKDVTCFFHYTFSVLLNACLVMYFVKKETVEGKSVSREVFSGSMGYFRAGILLLLVYLAVFSNMFGNIVLVTYAVVHAFRGLIKRGWKIREWISENLIFVMIAVMWLIAVVMQTQDPRNENARGQGATGSISGAVNAFISDITSVNKMAALIMVLFAAVFVIKWFYERKNRKKDNRSAFGAVSVELICSGILTALYLILLCGVASPSYLLRDDVRLGFFFYILLEDVLLMAVAVSGSEAGKDNVVENEGKLALVIPLISFILVSQTLNYCKSYKDFSMVGFTKEENLRVGNDLVDQFVAADEAGETGVELHVLLNDKAGDNWPYPSYCGDLISDTLYRHGITSVRLDATTVFDAGKNEELMISFGK